MLQGRRGRRRMVTTFRLSSIAVLGPQTVAKFPYFRCEGTSKALLLNDRSNPQLAEAQVMKAGTVQYPLSYWNKKLVASAKDRDWRKTLDLFQQMQQEGMQSDAFTFTPVLKACTCLLALQEGRDIHRQIMQSGCASDPFVATSLINMYAKCGSIAEAQKVFNEMPIKDAVTWTAMIVGHVKCGQGEHALALFAEMQLKRVEPIPSTFVGVLNACASIGAIDEGRHVHAQVTESACGADAFVGSSLIHMYTKCGCIEDAFRVFDKLHLRNVLSWNAMIQGYAKCGLGKKALELYQQMEAEEVRPNAFTFVGLLNACASMGALELGRRVHAQVIESDCQSDLFVGSSLVDMYAKCGSIEDASRVFNKMPTRDAISWTAMIVGYAKCGEGHKALELYKNMQANRVKPVMITFVGALMACANLAALEAGQHVHAQIVRSGSESNLFVATSLVDMYCKCGSLEDAYTVFSRMRTRNVVSWSAIILGHVKCGQGWKALELYGQMQAEGVEPALFTFIALLNACASVAALEEGRRIHTEIIKGGLELDVFVGSSLVDMYSKCGSIEDACRVFSKLHMRNVVSWNAMILGHAKCGQGKKAIELYEQMRSEGVDPNPVTFVAVLNACASVGTIEKGRCFHKQIIQNGCETDGYVVSSLVDMYWKCGSIKDARKVFDRIRPRDVVSWNAMILGHVKSGQAQKALELYEEMQSARMDLDSVTFAGVLNACASLKALEQGRHIHEQIIQNGFCSDVFVCGSLVDMYSKCGSMEDAERVFNKVDTKSRVSWNAMILGHVRSGEGQKALGVFKQMQREGMEPDTFTYVGVLNACASVAALEEGRHIHADIISHSWFASDVFVGTSLVNMYAKCGSIEDARIVFNKMPVRDITSWNAMLGGLAMHGYSKEAIQTFELMCNEGVIVDRVTFVSLLSACSHGGLLEEGLQYFESMSLVYRISPTEEHYACMVDLLGRTGCLHEAEDIIRAMSCEADITVWRALLGACRVHGNLEMGERIAKQVLELDPEIASGYVGLSNIYAAAGKWDHVQNVHCIRKERNISEKVGCTWMEVNNELHSFSIDDQMHAQIVEIHAELRSLFRQMEEAGYALDTSSVLQDVEEEKLSQSCHHSQRLSIAFGHERTPPRTPLHILSNTPPHSKQHWHL